MAPRHSNITATACVRPSPSPSPSPYIVDQHHHGQPLALLPIHVPHPRSRLVNHFRARTMAFITNTTETRLHQVCDGHPAKVRRAGPPGSPLRGGAHHQGLLRGAPQGRPKNLHHQLNVHSHRLASPSSSKIRFNFTAILGACLSGLYCPNNSL